MGAARYLLSKSLLIIHVSALISVVLNAWLAWLLADTWEGSLWPLGCVAAGLFGLFGSVGVLAALNKRHESPAVTRVAAATCLDGRPLDPSGRGLFVPSPAAFREGP